MFLYAWLIYPVVLALLAFGCGLAVRRAAGPALAGALVVPVGLAALVVVATALTFLDATAELAAPAMALLALAGLALALRGGGLRGWRRPWRAWMWPAVAALAPALAIALPVLVTGRPGFTGFLRIVDLAFQLDLAEHLVTEGRSIPADPQSSLESVAARTLGAGYPGGTQAVLAATARVAGIDTIWAWQGFLAFLGAMLGLALWSLLGAAIAWRPGRAVAAGVAAQPTVLYAYGITSGIKELGAAALVALCAAVLTAPRTREVRASAGAALPVVLTVLAGLAVFTLGIVPWIAVLLIVVLGPRLARARRVPRLTARASLAVAVGVVVVAVPLALTAVRAAPVLRAGGPADLGNLAAPVPPWAAIGPWLTGDHRFPLAVAGTLTPTAVLAAIVLVLALAGVARAVAGRDVGLVAIAAAGAVGLAIVVLLGAPWVELKAITTTAPLTVALAFAGAAVPARRRRLRPLALAAGALVAVAVLAGNALVYLGTSLAPYERLAELQRINERYAGQGSALHPVWDEYAEYLLRDLDLVSLTNPLGYEDDLRPQAPPRVQFVRDLDDFPLEQLQRRRLIVTRRDPTMSRPPSGFTLAERTRYYEIWERREDTRRAVFHAPLGALYGARTAAVCDRLSEELRAAGPGARLAYAQAPTGLLFTAVTNARLYLAAGAAQRLARGPGFVGYRVTVPETGRYAVWLSGSFGREVVVRIDGRLLDRLRWQGNYPLQYEPVGTVELAAGTYELQVRRGGGSLLPGTSNEPQLEGTTTRIGPVVLAPPGPRRRPVRIASPPQARGLCASEQEWDWAEVTAPVRAADATS